MKTKIIVNNPCHIDWNAMTATEKGKYCGACKKVVVDFSDWKTEEIKDYIQNQSNRVCGHFKKSQVEVKRPIHHQFLVNLHDKINASNKFRWSQKAALWLVFLCMAAVGCNRPLTGKPENEHPSDNISLATDTTKTKDSTLNHQRDSNMIDGKIDMREVKGIVKYPIKKDSAKEDKGIEEIEENMILGEVAPYPIEPENETIEKSK
ncbi:MAG: hypothetical protein R3A43_01795 [Bacteroidia bacterium]